ncbi:MAG: response regulator [Pontiellaceae bacterium]|nr:response regulator [Pontiellaceae bacterium]
MPAIVLIDDDPTVQKAFSRYLSASGYEVQLANDGRQGLRMIEAEPPDLVITDIMMPEMDGLEILMAIRKLDFPIPVIAISGGMRALPLNFLRHAKDLGARYVFEKPVPLKQLLSAVQELIG